MVSSVMMCDCWKCATIVLIILHQISEVLVTQATCYIV